MGAQGGGLGGEEGSRGGWGGVFKEERIAGGKERVKRKGRGRRESVGVSGVFGISHSFRGASRGAPGL